jgi:hypothetical protein
LASAAADLARAGWSYPGGRAAAEGQAVAVVPRRLAGRLRLADDPHAATTPCRQAGSSSWAASVATQWPTKVRVIASVVAGM